MDRRNKLGRILMVEDAKDVELTLTALEEYNLANEVVVLDARLQPTNPAHRLAASINEGIYSKVPEPDQV